MMRESDSLGLRRIGVPAVLGTAALVGSMGAYAAFVASDPANVLALWSARSLDVSLAILGVSATLEGHLVVSESVRFAVVPECTVFLPLAVFAAAVFAYPSPWRRKGVGLLLGIVALSAINTVRLVSLFYVADSIPAWYNTVHVLIWQPLMILGALGLWALWAAKVARPAS